MTGQPSRTDEPTIERVSSIGAVPAAAWDRLGGPGSSLYLSHAWLRWAEADQAFRSSYLLARDGRNRLVGALPCYLWAGGTGSLNAWYDPLHVLVRPHLPGLAEEAWSPVLLLGSRSGYHSDVALDPGLSPRQRAVVVDALLGEARLVAEASGARTRALMYAPEPAARRVEHLAGGAARAVPTSAEAILDARWDSFEHYLAQFRGNRRTSIRREVRTFEAGDVEVRTTSLGESYDRMGPLLGRLQRKYGFADTDAEMTARLAAQAVALDPISRVFLGLRAGRLVGFCLGYVWQDQLYVRSTGFDPDAGSEAFDYFNLVIYRTLRYAIEGRLSSVNLGLSAFRGKVARGAALSPLWSVVWPPEDTGPASLAALALPAGEAVEAETLVPGTFGRVGAEVRIHPGGPTRTLRGTCGT